MKITMHERRAEARPGRRSRIAGHRPGAVEIGQAQPGKGQRTGLEGVTTRDQPERAVQVVARRPRAFRSASLPCGHTCLPASAPSGVTVV